MQADLSQEAMSMQDPPPNPQKKERKPRNKSATKGKGRDEGALAAFAPSNVKNGLDATQDEARPVEDSLIWPWMSLVDAPVGSHPPVFTRDCRYFFSVAGASVKIYATATAQVVSTLSSSASGSTSSSSQLADGHTNDITAILINPRNAFQLLTASLDGRIKVWDFLDAALLGTIVVGEPITHMCAHENMRDHVIVSTSSHHKRQKSDVSTRPRKSRVYRVSLRPTKATAQQALYRPANILNIGNMKPTTALAISPSGLWLVATGGRKAYVWSMSSISSGYTKFVSNETLTCLAFHPSEEYFATGDQKGQIRLWYCLNDVQTLPRPSGDKRAHSVNLHWHAHAVSSIAFTANGSYLLSGGEEAVLVIWQLHTGKREYVPRVGAPIVSLAVASHQYGAEEYLLVLADGTQVFVGAGNLQISRSFSRIKLDPNYRSSRPALLAVHSPTSTLILPSSHPSSLLIYAPLSSTLLAELEVSPSNRVSRRDEEPIEPLRVDSAVVSDSGAWLATIDGRGESEDFEREIYLKIWEWDASKSSWALNSRIDRPHGVHRVNSLTFSAGDRLLLISAGDDGNVKVWRTRAVSNKKGEQEVFWVCRSILEYRSHIPTDLACSPDGSLLAVALGPQAVVFELVNNVLRLALTCPEIKEVSCLSFVGSSGRFVAVAGRRDVVLWDLVTSSVRWHCPSTRKICHLVPHPIDNSFAVMYRDHHPSPTLVHIFNAVSSSPVSTHTLPFQLRKVVWYPYNASGSDFTLVGINQAWKTVVFGDRIQAREEEGSSARGISADGAPRQRNMFQEIFGASAFQDFSNNVPATSTPQADSLTPLKMGGVLNVPAYLLPPLHTLFTPLLEGLLRGRSAELSSEAREVPEPPEDEDEDEDVVMADAPAVISPPSRTFSEGEMDDFVELFKEQTFRSAGTSLAILRNAGHTNGNGVAKTVNGTHRRNAVSTPTSVNGKNHPPKRPVERVDHTQDSSPTVIGKKRKKSMG